MSTQNCIIASLSKNSDFFLIDEHLQQILKEIDDEFTDEELDEVIAEVGSCIKIRLFHDLNFQIDIDKSTTIDFNEFVKLMTF